MLSYVSCHTQIYRRKGRLRVQQGVQWKIISGQQAPPIIPQEIHHWVRHQSLQNPGIEGLGLHRQKVNRTSIREYRYDVQLKGAGIAFMISNLVYSWRVFVTKKMVYWPFIVVIPVAYAYINPMYTLIL